MHEVTMPKAGQSMEDGTVVRWLVAEGQSVAAGQVLLEVETDKATIEVEATHGGTLRKILCPEGHTVPVHTVIALVGEPDEEISAAQAAMECGGPLSLDGRGWPGGPGEGAALGGTSPAPSPAIPQPATRNPQLSPGAVIPVLMPKAGQSMEEGTLVAWRVKPGDVIRKGDVIFEVETDKATIEVEATDSGRLARIVAEKGAVIEVLRPVAFLADNDAAVDAFLAGSTGLQPVAGSTGLQPAAGSTGLQPVASSTGYKPVLPSAGLQSLPASPAARKIARERNVDLSAIAPGRGPGGRILSDDVLAAKPGAKPAAAAHAPAVPGQSVRRRMTNMRKAIARNLLASTQGIPHFYMRLTVDADPLYNFYKAQKAQYPCTLNDVVVMALAKALAEFPEFRSRIDKDELVEFPTANIGIAVGTDGGLVVPVLQAAETLDLRQLAAQSKRIVEAARAGKLEGVGLGVFTITNLGMFGVEEFTAIINPPEASILAVGAIREQVIVRNGAMRPGRVLTMTLSADHRVIDGLLAAKFLARLKELLEQPGV